MRTAFVVAFAVLCGCYSVSARKANIEGLTTDREVEPDDYRHIGERVSGRACATSVLLFFGFGDRTDSHRLAEELVKERDADVLVDAEMESSYWGTPLLFGRYCTRVSGRPAVAKVQAPTGAKTAAGAQGRR